MGPDTSNRRPDSKSGRPEGRTTGRSELSRHPQFAQVSPQVGALDEDALRRALSDDPDAALAMLAELLTATDERLRSAAHRIAARLVLDRSRVGHATRQGSGRPREVPATRGGDLDLDTSLEAVASAHAERRPPSLDELVARDWGRPELALCVLVDTSGSMTGARLAAAAMTAAACALRAPGEHAVLAFSRAVRVIRPMTSEMSPSATVDRVLQLRGHGVTALATALRAANDQLGYARAQRKVVVLLSDCRATDEEDPVPSARSIPELLILAPSEDHDEASRLASASGARFAAMPGAASAPALLDRLLG